MSLLWLNLVPPNSVGLRQGNDIHVPEESLQLT